MELSRFWMGLLLIGVLLCGLWFPATAQVYEQEMPADWQEKDVLRITAFAVGEGDALLLRCGGESMMVDGGPKPFRDPMKEAMEQRGVRHFKYLLNTHSHDDHIDGLYYLMLNGFTADEYLHPYSEWWARADKELHGRTIKLTEKLGIPNRQVGEGDTLTLGGAELKLHRYTKVNNTNAKSLLAKVTFGSATALLCADITGRAQKGFLTQLEPEELKADVIKIPHHGITPVEPDFLTAVSPEFAIVTNYADEKRLSKLMYQLEGRGIPHYFSGEGTVELATDGTDWYVWQTLGEF